MNSRWWQLALAAAVTAFVMLGSPAVPKAHADCFAWVICSKEKPDPNVDQTQLSKPSPAYLKLPKKAQKFWAQQCFSGHYDYSIRTSICKKWWPGWNWKDPKANWTATSAIDPVNIVSSAVKGAAGSFIEKGMQALANLESDGVRWLMQESVSLIGISTEPSITAGYVNQLNNIFSIGMLIAMLGMSWGWLKGSYRGSITDAVLSVGFFVRFLLFGAGALIFVFWALNVVDHGITPELLNNVEAANTQALKEMSNVDFTKGVKGAALPVILPVLYLIPALFGGFIMMLELIIRMLMILVLIPALVLSLAMGSSNSAWAEEKLRATIHQLAGWILLPPILAFVLATSFGLLHQTQAVTGHSWPIGITAVILMTFSPVIAWEISRAITKHSFGSRSVYYAVRQRLAS